MRYLSCVLLGLLLMGQTTAEAGKQPAAIENKWLTENIRLVLSGEMLDPADSTQNPGNAFLRIPRYVGTFSLRPDFFAETSLVNGTFKPRVTAWEARWRDGAPAGMRSREARLFVNEWEVQPKVHDRLILSFGKEKLLWGPSFVVSPSNVLFRDTEKANPKSEIEGKYLGRAIWMPGPAMTLTVISETRRHDAPSEQQRPYRAVKIDVLGGGSMVSVIGYLRRDDGLRIGSFGQWTASDGLLLYYDGRVTKGTDMLYPVPDPAHPLGGDFQRLSGESNRLFATVTAGGGYTFLSGETLSAEFLYNGAGYGDSRAAEYYRLRRTASDHFTDSGPGGQFAPLNLAGAAAAGADFLRRYYLMAQLQTREFGNNLNFIIRYTHGLEERAGRASSIIEWKLSGRVLLYSLYSAAFESGRENEFNTVLRKSFLLGLEASW